MKSEYLRQLAALLNLPKKLKDPELPAIQEGETEVGEVPDFLRFLFVSEEEVRAAVTENAVRIAEMNSRNIGPSDPEGQAFLFEIQQRDRGFAIRKEAFKSGVLQYLVEQNIPPEDGGQYGIRADWKIVIVKPCECPICQLRRNLEKSDGSGVEEALRSILGGIGVAAEPESPTGKPATDGPTTPPPEENPEAVKFGAGLRQGLEDLLLGAKSRLERFEVPKGMDGLREQLKEAARNIVEIHTLAEVEMAKAGDRLKDVAVKIGDGAAEAGVQTATGAIALAAMSFVGLCALLVRARVEASAPEAVVSQAVCHEMVVALKAALGSMFPNSAYSIQVIGATVSD